MSAKKDTSPKKDLTQVRASAATRETLETLKRRGHISDMLDGYRLGISVAIAFGRKPADESDEGRTNYIAAGNLDPDHEIRRVVREVYPEWRDVPMRAAEDLAEQGVSILAENMIEDDIEFAKLVSRIERANVGVAGAETATTAGGPAAS
jgi:hypothetical protein